MQGESKAIREMVDQIIYDLNGRSGLSMNDIEQHILDEIVVEWESIIKYGLNKLQKLQEDEIVENIIRPPKEVKGDVK